MSRTHAEYIHFRSKELGSIKFAPQDFPEEVYHQLDTHQFRKLSVFEKHEAASRALFEAIQQDREDAFVLPKVVAFISRMREVITTYHITSFEFWLNHFSGLSDEEQQKIRGKIVGKFVPRSAYQKIFPIGMGVKHTGPHFSFAHYSPDLDTTVASFQCYMAAFGCRIAGSRHHWIVPGGPPKGSIELDFIFRDALGQDVFKALSRSEKKVQISSLDLLTQKNIEKKSLKDFYYNVDHSRSKKAVILIEDNGRYIGDWRHMDVDPVRSIIGRFWQMMVEHKNMFHIGLISLFAKEQLRKEDLQAFAQATLSKQFADCACTSEFTGEHRRKIDHFLKEVVGVSEGFGCTYDHLLSALSDRFHLTTIQEEIVNLAKRPFFDEKGVVIDHRGKIFSELEKVITAQKEGQNYLLRHFDMLGVANQVKRRILGLEPNYLSHTADLDQILKQMGDYSHLTVNYKEGDYLYPLGVIHASDLHKQSLATASWNDFSNPDETDSRPEIEVISYIDHHKSSIKTSKPAMGIVMDAQSCNSIYANLLMEMNDQYSSGGMTLEQIESQITASQKNLNHPVQVRILGRLLRRKDALLQNQHTSYYIAYEREILEYLQTLYAILDDTDLLTKVTEYDVDVVAQLLNRLKSLMLRQEVEIVHFDDLSRADPDFVKYAAKKILQTYDLYSLYSITYKAREEAVEEVLADTARGVDTHFFQDTKLLGEYACIGQFKYFSQNAPTFQKKSNDLRKIWANRCRAQHKDNPDLLFFLFMCSTISSAEELYANKIEDPKHLDEIWFWVPEKSESSLVLIKNFLSGFVNSPALEKEPLEIHFYGKCEILEKACEDAINRPFEKMHYKGEGCTFVMRVPQKRIVSRKSQVAPYL